MSELRAQELACGDRSDVDGHVTDDLVGSRWLLWFVRAGKRRVDLPAQATISLEVVE